MNETYCIKENEGWRTSNVSNVPGLDDSSHVVDGLLFNLPLNAPTLLFLSSPLLHWPLYTDPVGSKWLILGGCKQLSHCISTLCHFPNTYFGCHYWVEARTPFESNRQQTMSTEGTLLPNFRKLSEVPT